ncbi:hypothetical protein C8T65DRAFT_577277 [Cerioporus squamosus]|nr:hypothetical protein C8T65DRAFT_577277 [Cerioporus squamosus]
MHTSAINYFDLMLDLWRGTITGSTQSDPKTWDCAVLQDEVWDRHGVEVEWARPFLPGFFDRAPRNIALKMNSGFKAIEKQNYLFGYGPNMLRKHLPEKHWSQLCKTVRAVRLLSAYTISSADLVEARRLLDEATVEFEDIYYGRDPDKLHVVRPVIHKMWHAPDQVVAKGSLVCRTQFPMEREFGILFPQVKQHSNPFANLSAVVAREVGIQALMALLPSLDRHQDPRRLPRGAMALGDDYDLLRALQRHASPCTPAESAAFHVYYSEVDPDALNGRTRDEFTLKVRRWARVRLPNNQVARSAWKECQKPLCRLRMARCVKFVDSDGNIHVGEVQYFCITRRARQPVAIVSVFAPRDALLYQKSSKTIELMEHRGDEAIRVINIKSIRAVVGMIPDKVITLDEYKNDHRHLHAGRKYFVMEKMGYALALGSRDPEMDIDE